MIKQANSARMINKIFNGISCFRKSFCGKAMPFHGQNFLLSYHNTEQNDTINLTYIYFFMSYPEKIRRSVALIYAFCLTSSPIPSGKGPASRPASCRPFSPLSPERPSASPPASSPGSSPTACGAYPGRSPACYTRRDPPASCRA